MGKKYFGKHGSDNRFLVKWFILNNNRQGLKTE